MLLDYYVAIERDGSEDVDAVHPQQSQQKACHTAEILPEFPAKLSGGGEVHRNTEHGHDQLAEGDVHQEEVELRLQLKHWQVIFNLSEGGLPMSLKFKVMK